MKIGDLVTFEHKPCANFGRHAIVLAQEKTFQDTRGYKHLSGFWIDVRPEMYLLLYYVSENEYGTHEISWAPNLYLKLA